jgi:hypothetical protein
MIIWALGMGNWALGMGTQGDKAIAIFMLAPLNKTI